MTYLSAIKAATRAVKWLEHGLSALRWIPTVVVVLACGQIVAWAMDRKSPFIVMDGYITPPAHPGGVLRINGKVKRDLSRDCDLEVTQWIEDSNGYRHYLSPVAMRSESIRKLEEFSPGETHYAAPIPPTVHPGYAIYHAESRYSCNPVHELWPITILTRIPFEVVAP